MTIGLVSEPKVYTRRLAIKRFFGIRSKDKVLDPENPFDVLVSIIQFSKEKLENMPAERLDREIKSHYSFLIKMGADKVILSRKIKALCRKRKILTYELNDGKGKNLFLRLVPECIRSFSRKYGIDLMNSLVCIRDNEMGRISEYLIRALCFDVTSLVLATEKTARAERICEAFYDETGLYVKTAENTFKNADILIDVDRCCVRIGRDLYIREAEFGYRLDGYKVNQADIAVHISRIRNDKIRWIFNYKKTSDEFEDCAF